MANKKLGKGLGAIFGDDINSVLDEISRSGNDERVVGEKSIKISDIRTNPYQPRKVFDKQALEELAESIKQHGVFTPILVRKSLNGYELIAGERRLRASKLAKLEEIPATIVDFDDRSMMEIALLENIQREDLNVVEEANGYNQLIKKLGYTQEELATRLGKSRVYITNILRLLKLPASILKMISDGKLSYGHARALITLDDESAMKEIANRIVEEKLSVREVEKLVNNYKNPISDTQKKEKKEDPFIKDITRNIERKLSTKVEIKKHQINIDYNGVDDLNRILELLGLIEK